MTSSHPMNNLLKFIHQSCAWRSNNDHLTPSPSPKRRGERRI